MRSNQVLREAEKPLASSGEGQKVHPESYLDTHPFLLEEKEERFVSLLFLPFQTDRDSDGPR